MINLLERAKNFEHRMALVSKGRAYSYKALREASNSVAANLLKGKKDLNGARVAFLVPPSFEYTAVQWGIWAAGGVAVPLCVLHPLPSIEYVIEDTQATMVDRSSGFCRIPCAP